MASARSMNAGIRTSENPNLRTSYLGKGRGRSNRTKTTESSATPVGGTNGGDKDEAGRNSPAEVGKDDAASKAEGRVLELLKEMCQKRTGAKTVKFIRLSPKEEDAIIETVLGSVSTGEEVRSLVSSLYDWCLTDPTTTSCVANLCATLCKFEKDDVCFRKVLLLSLQKDYQDREGLRQGQALGMRWLAFVCFLCDLYAALRTSNNEYLHPLEEPVFTCLAKVLTDEESPELNIEYATLKLKKIGKILQEYEPTKMDLLMDGLRARLLGPNTTPMGRLQLLEIIELYAGGWQFDQESEEAYTALRVMTKEEVSSKQ